MRAGGLTINQDTLVIGEGQEEVAVITQMMAEELIPPVVVSHPGMLGGAGGTSGFEPFLQALVGLSDFERVRSIGIIVDNDEDPTASFDSVRRAIQAANANEDVDQRFSVPLTPYVKANTSRVSVGVFMSPAALAPGCLESIVLAALSDTRPDAASCVEDLLRCCNLGWPIQKLDKARVRSLIATTHRRNPALALSWLWMEDPMLAPVSSPAFRELIDFIRSL